MEDLAEQVAALDALTPLERIRSIDEIVRALGQARRKAIRAAVEQTSQSAVARELGVTRQAVQLLVHPRDRRR